jgi:heterodisulfide reductase subunit C
MIQPINKALFNKSACSLCGDCLHLCPEINLPIDVAKEEKKFLIAGKGSKYVLSHCTTCFSCNLICPNDRKSYELIFIFIVSPRNVFFSIFP